MDLPRISPKKYDEWKLKEPPEEPFFEEPTAPKMDWWNRFIEEGEFYFINGEYVSVDEVEDWAEDRYRVIYFEDGKEV